MTTTFVCSDDPRIDVSLGDAVSVAGLCGDPARLLGVAPDTERAVLVLHAERYDMPSVQKVLRRADLDPLGAQILDVGTPMDPGAITTTVAGLRSRADAFVSANPEHAKPVLPDTVTRRGFLRPPAPVYIAAPGITHSTCAASNGCRACVDVCPQDAYLWRSGRIAYDKDVCAPCGQCVTTCPTASIENPSTTAAMVEGQVRTLVNASDAPIGIRFVCSRGSMPSQAGWFDVSVPCTSMVPGSWLIACLLTGAGGAHAVPCREAGCELELDEGALRANDLASAVLSDCGLDPKMIDGASILESMQLGSIEDGFGRHSSPDVYLAIADVAQRELVLEHRASNVGVVEINAEACTLCGQCAKTCPTGALAEMYAGDTVSISFDARACVNCTQCVSACPEFERGAITVAGRIDTQLMASGRMDLNFGSVATCEVCGKAIAPSSMMDRIGDLLGEEFEATMGMLANRCLDCRGR